MLPTSVDSVHRNFWSITFCTGSVIEYPDSTEWFFSITSQMANLPKAGARFNLKISKDFRDKFEQPYDKFVHSLVRTSQAADALSEKKLDSILRRSPVPCANKAGSNWTIWLDDEARNAFISLKAQLLPKGTHCQFVSILLAMCEQSCDTSASSSEVPPYGTPVTKNIADTVHSSAGKHPTDRGDLVHYSYVADSHPDLASSQIINNYHPTLPIERNEHIPHSLISEQDSLGYRRRQSWPEIVLPRLDEGHRLKKPLPRSAMLEPNGDPFI